MPFSPTFPLPIDDAIPPLRDALSRGTNAVLVAPPGAGKTTRVPLALLHASWIGSGRILMLEPRRVAARAAAERMAESLGESVGETVGYRIRRDRRVSASTRIEVVTEGILTRILQSDPELTGVAAVLFDEFHERSIHADLGLALCLECQQALRDDLRLLVMSATLDGEAVAALLGDAPLIRSEGRMYPVDTRWREAPWRGPRAARDAFERAVTATIIDAHATADGDMLVFLPGIGEIARTARLLEDRPELHDTRVVPLHGGLPFVKQRAALRPDSGGKRRIVLATTIAETSLTIEGVRIVVDGGLVRRPCFDPGAGMTRLMTVRVSKAGAEQRRGRAGRLGPGVCYRVWTRGEEGGLAAKDRPEILDADLVPMILELALWGVLDPETLRWLDPPPDSAVVQARETLGALGALDEAGRITAHGKALAAQPMHPRLAHMRIVADGEGTGDLATELAALLEERDPLSGAGVDIAARVAALRNAKRFREEHVGQIDQGALARIREGVRALGGRAAGTPLDRIGGLIALAYPDRIAQRRPGDAPRYVMSGGRGAVFPDDSDPLAGEPFLAIAHLDGNPREARIRLAARLTRADIETRFSSRIVEGPVCEWSTQTQGVVARLQRRLGPLILEDRNWKNADGNAIADAALQGLRQLGLQVLPWDGAAGRLRARVMWLRAREDGDDPLPDWSDEALLTSAQTWLLPYLDKVRSKADFERLALETILRGTLDYRQVRRLDALAPDSIPTPAGSKARIDYDSDPPALEVRIQEMFGCAEHPAICNGRVPLLIRFLSPARRPVQVTGDLLGFWASSYLDVRKDMRGRYPKHPWPENPLEAAPTLRRKPTQR